MVNPHGASLAELTYDGRDVVVPQDGRGGPPLFRGAVLAPWPNRIHDGRYRFGGTVYEVEVNEPSRNAALHGQVFGRDWEIADPPGDPTAGDLTADRVRMKVGLGPETGYPFTLRLQIDYALGPRGLDVRLTATNTGDS